MFRILLSLLFVLFFNASALAQQLKFVQITDVHLSQNGNNYHGRNLTESVSNLKGAITSINSMNNVAFTVFSGDNIDEPNPDDLKKFCEITSTLKKPYYITIGNHDTLEVSELPKKEYFKILAKYDKNIKNLSPNYYNYYFLPNKDIAVVMLDGTINLRMATAHGFYYDETVDWLDKTLTKLKNKQVIIVQHFPLVEPYERKDHRTKDPEKYLEVLKNHPNVKAILSGHYHGYNVIQQDGIYHVSAPALVNNPSEFLVITVDYDKKSFELKTEKVGL